MKYNPTIHNRRSIRLKNYDYSNGGAYFITICCKARACLFGEIVHGEMKLNANGRIAYDEWLHTTKIRMNVELDVFVIMPNHIHGIIIINNTKMDVGRGVLYTPPANVLHTPNTVLYTAGGACNMQTFDLKNVCNSDYNKQSLIIQQGVCNTPLRSPSNTIGAIVRVYKSAVTKKINLQSLVYNKSAIIWQRNYYEHIIRDGQSYQNISDYIVNNPSKWFVDKFHQR